MKQPTLFDEIYIDEFAGGGGASTGIEMATGRPIDIAINHDESAIMMHRRNHPFTRHYREDVWAVDPMTATQGRPVRLIWFSPDCKHFSKAKGAALVDKKIRGLAWVVLRWAAAVKPDVIMLENVEEFTTWGPVRKGRPIKKKAGETYRKWYRQLSDLGYKIDTRVLCAADYGAPTIRKRFCLIARCDGEPIAWPERTHAPRESGEVKSGRCKPWRSAAEIIDFSLPTYSIFESKEAIKEKYGVRVQRPLKPNTLRRIAKGTDNFVIKSAEPFIIECNHSNDRVHALESPLNTVTSKYTGGVVVPKMVPYIVSNNGNNAPHAIHDPVPTITTGNRNLLLSPTLIQYHTEQSDKEVRGQGLRDPLRTVDGSNRYGLAAVHLTQYFSGERHYHSVEDPLATITTMEREGVVSAYLSEWYGNPRDGISLNEPVQTITAKDREALTAVHLAHFKGKDKGQSIRDPLLTVTARDGQFAEIRATVVKWDGQADLGYWSEVRKLLNEYCGYNLADDEVLLLNIRGAWYFISDIGLRMLTPRELYNAQGFPADYIIDRDCYGNKISRSAQVARCGNSVCPPMAEAMVRANLQECQNQIYASMDELHRAMVS